MQPFSKIGVNFAEPLYVKVAGTGKKKVYIAFFSCCVTRAIHLELLQDLAAEAFRRALKRFTARGVPTLINPTMLKHFKQLKRNLTTCSKVKLLEIN